MKNLCKILFLSMFLLLGCESGNGISPKSVKFDRDVCERCKMVVSDKYYAAQVINQDSKEYYFFDDIGCAVLWFKEQNITWEKSALVFVADSESGKWLDAKKAFFTDGAKSPMRFGFAAHEKDQGNNSKSFHEVKMSILESRNATKPMSHHSR